MSIITMGVYKQWTGLGIVEWRTRFFIFPLIKTHGSESRGQEEAGLRDEPVSYLQVAPL